MKRFAGTALLVFVVAVSACVDDRRPQPKAPVRNDTVQENAVQNDSAAILKKDSGDIPPPSEKPRAISQEGIDYLQNLRNGTPYCAFIRPTTACDAKDHVG